MCRTILIGLAKFIGFLVIAFLSFIIYHGVFTKRSAEKIADSELVAFCVRSKLDCNIFIKREPYWQSGISKWVIDYHTEDENIKVIVYVSRMGLTDVHSMFEEYYSKPLIKE